MMNKKMLFFTTFLFLITYIGFAQPYLSPEDAVAIALKNNFDILIAGKQTEIAKENEKIGRAGFLPEVDVALGNLGSNRNLRQLFVSGNEVNQNNVINSELNYAVNLNWVIFDGKRMFIQNKAFKNESVYQQWILKQKVEDLASEILTTYYGLVAEKSLYVALLELENLTQKKFEIASDKWKVGVGSKLDVILAELDLKNVKSDLAVLQNNTNNNKIALLQLMGENILDKTFTTDDSISFNQQFIDQFESKDLQLNPELNALKHKLTSAKLFTQEQKSYFLPKISFQSSYTGIRAEADAGFLLKNQNFGLNYGLVATMPVFTGGKARVALENAKLNEDIAKLEVDKSFLTLQKAEKIALNNLKSYTQLTLDAKERVTLAYEYIQLSLQRYENALSSIVEVKESQRMFAEAQYNLANFSYLAKQAELTLMLITGSLVQ
jgi:outer membrane protein